MTCKGSKSVDFDANATKNKIQFKIKLGLDNTSIAINDAGQYYNLSKDFNKIAYKIGTEIEYVLPYNKNTWSIFVNPIYQNFESEKTYIKNDGFGVIGGDFTIQLKYNYSSLDIPFGVRHYYFLNPNSKLFFNIGYSYNLISNAKLKFDYSDRTKDLRSSSRNNLLFGFGYTFNNKYSAEFMFNTKREILSDYLSWSVKQGSFGILLGYTLF
ncbi:MAG: outer membrane beta-barrel protein [Flavobacterium sp.]|nr:outer membrane beta-barrel protein [Flavobacterium sp.]